MLHSLWKQLITGFDSNISDKCKIRLLKICKKKTLKRYYRRTNAAYPPWARREHAAATSCAPYKRHGRYKDTIRTSCRRCRDAERTLCIPYFPQLWYFSKYFAATPTRADRFQNTVQTLWHRRLVWQWLYCYIILVNSILCVDFPQLI